ncbi:LysM peptidoglycan-binding domain-containing protein [Salmonella enterica]|uniref:LysM domain-containing protein n=4 Tax=Kuttervirus TaxID=2169536 RepID=A0A2Z3DPC3_9CAUD|nr:endolysin [Salmonella phage STML-13-1]YP_009880172.1 endolysin [Escherichia phage EP75]AGF88595.1 hypothetical protein SP063_00722 [Salmonella phage FSL SP-063]AGF89109.1 hypothetical protein SP029_00647 [Salmonella phage FSL SP-029]EBI9227155.1 LysM peptidoglycan-binding domain-containing protein [Salmonella enterica]EDW4918134.1 LysM peptidoglycan-binding domain-containing protein [Salmonella enterica subsp. enterica]AFU64206.1 hypothetical protein [Salmonella phage STML-13-1]
MISKYIVKPGDTLSSIALKLYGDAQQYIKLARFNNIQNPGHIAVGQVICLPTPVEDKEHIMIPVQPTQKCLDAIAGLFRPGFCDGTIERHIYQAIVENAGVK